MSEYVEVRRGTYASIIDIRYTLVRRWRDGRESRVHVMAGDLSGLLDRGVPVVVA